MSTVLAVLQFHSIFGHQIGKFPSLPPENCQMLRIQLIAEELGELAHAFASQDIVAILDALTDLQYVLDGTYVSCGLHTVKDAAFNEVHRSNLSKLNSEGEPILDSAGRVVKSDQYEEPDLRQFLNKPPTKQKFNYGFLDSGFCEIMDSSGSAVATVYCPEYAEKLLRCLNED